MFWGIRYASLTPRPLPTVSAGRRGAHARPHGSWTHQESERGVAINAQNPLHPLGRLLSVEDPVEESPEF